MEEPETIVVFGGSSGIGRTCALLAAKAGKRVRAVGRNRELLNALAKESSVETAQADIRNSGEVVQALSGMGRVDHVIVSAGTVTPAGLLSSDMDALRSPFEERVFGAMNVVRACAPLMSDGSFVFVTGDLVDRPVAGLGSVSAAATAVEALVRTWVLELSPLRFNILSPGVVDTPLQTKLFGDGKSEVLAKLAERIPLKRVGQVDELARSALLLIENRFINGATLHVDGGMRL